MTTDTLIIGSGVAAAAVAQRLLDSDPQADILVLEAGSTVKMQDYGLWENYLVTGKLPYDRYKDLDYADRDHPGENLSIGGTKVPLAGARVLTRGGSTIHWGGWSFRLKPEDFALKSRTGHGADWPITYDDLEPFYGQAEHYIGVSGDSNDSTVPRSRNYPYSAFPYTLEDKPLADAMTKLQMKFGNLPIARHGMSDTVSRHAPCQTTGTCKYCPFGARYAATNFLNDMLDWGNYPNFRIQDNAVVQELLMESRSRVKGVVYLDKPSGEVRTVLARRVIVAAGAIESAKLLLRSKSEFWLNGVGNDHDQVGRNFITHPYFIFTGSMPSNPLALQPEMNFPTLCSRHFDSEREQGCGKFILISPPGSPLVSVSKQMQNGVPRERIDGALMGPNQIELHGMLEVFSQPQNRVTNLDHSNHMGLYETVVDYTQDAGFEKRMTEIQQTVGRIFETMGANMVGKPMVSWRADHAACVCRMGDDPARSVVNRDLRVHAIDNLHLCSNAVFASLGAVNPTLTLTALALRLAEHLIKQAEPRGPYVD